jgi:hypothetical protein
MAIFDRICHGLFAKHVLSSSRGANRLFGVRTVYRGYEHGVNTGITQAPVVVFVGEAVLCAEFCPESPGSFPVVAYHGHELRVLAVLESWEDSDLRDAPQAYHRVTDAF